MTDTRDTYTAESKAAATRNNEMRWIFAVALLPAVFFFPLWLRPMAIGDNFLEFEPHFAYMFGRIRSFSDPLWNPYLFSGFPIICYPSSSIYNPLAWVHIIPFTVFATNLHLLLFYSISAVGFYLFARCLGLGNIGALTSGVMFSLCGYSLTCFPSALAHGGMPWIGFMLAALERLRQCEAIADRIKWTIIFSFAAALILISGHPFVFIQAAMFAGIYTLITGLAGERGKRRWIWFACALIGIALTPLLGAVNLLPGWELQRLSWRKEISFEHFSNASFSPSELLRSILFFRGGGSLLFTASIGIVPFLLAGYASIKTKDARFKACTFIAVLSVILMFGAATPLPRLLFNLPLFKLIAGFERFGVQFSMACAMLAGLGLEIFLREKQSIRNWIAAYSLLAITGGVLAAINNFDLLKGILNALALGLMSIAFLLAKVKTSKNYWMLFCLITLLLEPRLFIGGLLGNKDDLIDSSGVSPMAKFITVAKDGAAPPPRVLTVVDLTQHGMGEDFRMGAHNVSVFQKIHNASGYNPLIGDAYHRFLNMDFVGFPIVLKDLVAPPALILELIDVQDIIIPKEYLSGYYSRLWTFPTMKRIDGVPFLEECFITLKPGEELSFRVPEVYATGVGVISALTSSDVPQGVEALDIKVTDAKNDSRELKLLAGVDTAATAVRSFPENPVSDLSYDNVAFFPTKPVSFQAKDGAKAFYAGGVKSTGMAMISLLWGAKDMADGVAAATISIHGSDGAITQFPIRAGIETAEWALDVLGPNAKHSKPARAIPYISPEGYNGNKYYFKLDFGKILDIEFIEINMTSEAGDAGINVDRITLIGADGKYLPLYPDKPWHKTANIYSGTVDEKNSDVKFNLYWTLKKFGDPVKSKKCLLKNILPKGDVIVRGITLVADNGGSAPLSYIDHILGDPRYFDVIETPEASIYRKKWRSPRAWLAADAIPMEREEMLQTLKTGMLSSGEYFNPWTAALIDKDQPAAALPGGAGQGGVEFVNYAPNEIKLRVEADRRSMLMLGETYYPGWTAEVDGLPAYVYRADYVLRGVIVGQGRHEVTFSFKPKSVRDGRIISVMTLIVLSSISIALKFRGKNID